MWTVLIPLMTYTATCAVGCCALYRKIFDSSDAEVRKLRNEITGLRLELIDIKYMLNKLDRPASFAYPPRIPGNPPTMLLSHNGLAPNTPAKIVEG